MRALAKHLPLNSLGLPTGYWRPDLLPLREDIDDALSELDQPDNQEVNNEQNGPDLQTDPSAEDCDNGENFANGDQFNLFDNIAEGTHDKKEAACVKVSTAVTEASRYGSNKLPALLGIELPSITTPLGLPQEVLDSAFTPLSYEEGYPALPSGWPFWEPLEFEPPEAHQEFKRYLELGKKEFRILPQLANSSEHLEMLNLYSALYYWPIRARCYDLFYQASRKREREALVYDLELDHLKCAQKYRSQIEEYMDSSEFQELITPMVAVNLLKLCWQMERVSAGLPLNGAPNSNFSGGRAGQGQDVPQGSSLELVIRSMIKREREAVPEATVLNADGTPVDPQEDMASAFQDRLLSSPELVELAQELVLKLSTTRG
jgi:hypothetical protein